MEAVILSGGLGTRLRPLTLGRPKPLLPLANRPMIEHLLDRMPPEVDRAILAAGYLVDQLRAWAAKLDHRVEVVVVEEKTPMGTGGAIANVAREINGDFLCFNGDIFASLPVGELVARRREAGAMAALALWEVEDPSPFGVVALEGERILRFVEKPRREDAPSRLVNAGAYAFDHAVLDAIGEPRVLSLERDVFPRLLASGERMLGVPFEGYWVDCGRPDVYLEAHRLLLGDQLALATGARLDGTHRGWACLGEGAVAEQGSELTESVLFARARVGRNARLAQTIVGEQATVGERAVLTRCVVADRETVAPGAHLSDQRIGGD